MDNHYKDEPELEENRVKRSRKIIRKIITKKLKDGTIVPVEVTKTVIEKDGSRSVSRKAYD